MSWKQKREAKRWLIPQRSGAGSARKENDKIIKEKLNISRERTEKEIQEIFGHDHCRSTFGCWCTGVGAETGTPIKYRSSSIRPRGKKKC